MSLALSAPSDVRSHPQRSLKCFLVIGLSIEYPLLSPREPSAVPSSCWPEPRLGHWWSLASRACCHYDLLCPPGRYRCHICWCHCHYMSSTLPAPGSPLLPLPPHYWGHCYLPQHCRYPAQVAGRSKELLCVVCSSFAQLGGGWGQTEKTP